MSILVDAANAVLRRKPRISREAYSEKVLERGLTADGAEEVPSDVQVAPPIGYKKQPSMVDHIRQMVRSEQLRMAAEAAGAETFEEADDFEVEDDPVPVGSSELFEPDFEPPAPVAEPLPGSPPAAPPAAPAAAPSAAPGASPAPSAPAPSTST